MSGLTRPPPSTQDWSIVYKIEEDRALRPSPSPFVASSGQIGDLVYTMKPCRGYVLVCYQGQPNDAASAGWWMDHVEAFLRARKRDRVLWDSRGAGVNPPEARDAIWARLRDSDVLKCSAILVESQMLRTRTNIGSLSRKREIIRSFHDLDEAIEWLEDAGAQ